MHMPRQQLVLQPQLRSIQAYRCNFDPFHLEELQTQLIFGSMGILPGMVNKIVSGIASGIVKRAENGDLRANR